MKYFFLQSHYGTPYKEFLESLSKIQGTYATRSEMIYDHPTDLIRLSRQDRWAVNFIDTILENTEIQSQSVIKSVVNIFLLGGSCDKEDYLKFRLRRMYEIWKQYGGIIIPNEWNKLEEMFETKINRIEFNTSPIIDKYLVNMI